MHLRLALALTLVPACASHDDHSPPASPPSAEDGSPVKPEPEPEPAKATASVAAAQMIQDCPDPTVPAATPPASDEPPPPPAFTRENPHRIVS